MNKRVIGFIGTAIGGFVLGVITDHIATKDAIDKATKNVEETAENIVKARGAVEIGQKVIEDQGNLIDLLNNTIKEQDKKYKDLKEIVKNYRTLEKVNELAEEAKYD